MAPLLPENDIILAARGAVAASGGKIYQNVRSTRPELPASC
jgi:hypothetical protein